MNTVWKTILRPYNETSISWQLGTGVHMRRFLSVLCIGVFAALTARGADAQCSGYSVDILSGPDCQFEPSDANASAINQAGELCGAYYTCDNSGDAAVWLGDGPWIPLVSFPPGYSGFNPLDINLSRNMAGTTRLIQNPELPLAAIYDYETGSMTNLGTLPGHTESEALAINSNGVVVGSSVNSATGPLTAFVWQNGEMSALPLPFEISAMAWDISDSVLICGEMATQPTGADHAYIYDLTTERVVDVGIVFDNAISSRATGVNNAGTICGFSFIPCGKHCLTRKGFIWSNGIVQDLGVLPGTTNITTQAINDSNVVVGYCDPGGNKAVVWRNGTLWALNDLIPPELSLNITEAWDINNAGQIAGLASVIGSGGDRVAVRLTPIPSPIGDSDCDADIDVDDLLGVINNWAHQAPKGSTPPALPPCDFDHDGTVELDDLMIVIDNWTK